MKFTRRDTIILAAAASALSLSGVSVSLGAEGDVVDQAALMAPAGGLEDHVEGSADAPVTVVEYASPTCPHCATFHNSVYEPFKEQYIDTGKVKFIVRPFARNALDAAIFMLAEAAGPENYHNVIATFFRTQNDWGMSETPRDAMFAIAQQLGFNEESFSAALTNQEVFTGIEAQREQALDEFGLTGTPTFYVNGKTLSGGKTLEQLAAEIDPLVPADFVATEPAADAPAADAAAPAADTPTAPATNAPATDAPAAGTTPPATDSMSPATDSMSPATPAAPAQ